MGTCTWLVFSRFVRDFQDPQITPLHRLANRVQACYGWILVGFHSQELGQLRMRHMVELCGLYETHLLSVFVVLQIIHCVHQSFNG